jgi:ubiquinone/menaquinone biosynthesis C-methylase UbiE
MLAKTRRRGMSRIAVMDGEWLAFRDHSFDTVMSTLASCIFPDPVQALRDMRRVCRPGGRILLLEHGCSSHPRIAGWQDRLAPKWAAQLGCWWSREPLQTIRQAGLQPRAAERRFWACSM